jgi:hypothetical protein
LSSRFSSNETGFSYENKAEKASDSARFKPPFKSSSFGNKPVGFRYLEGIAAKAALKRSFYEKYF